MKYILLNPKDIHEKGDEMWIDREWGPVPPIHFGDQVGEGGPPCRRLKKPPTPEKP